MTSRFMLLVWFMAFKSRKFQSFDPITFLWGVVGLLRHLGLIGATLGNAVVLLLLAIGLAWVFAETGWSRYQPAPSQQPGRKVL